MKVIKQLLRKVDSFAVPLSFRYKNDDIFSTSFGGFITILFGIISLSLGIYYFIPFINRKNYTLVYYSMKLPTTDKIKLSDSKATFALGLECKPDTKKNITAEDLLQLQYKFFIYSKSSNGTRSKVGETLATHKCTYADFYNEYNDTFDILNLQNLECLDKKNHVIEGIFTDETFSYYEFTVLTKADTKENSDLIDYYLKENDCKFVLYYTDISFDLDNYKAPIKPFINQIFIQLDPTLFLKMNTYFMNQYFRDDDYLIFNFDEEKPITRTLYSREELYWTYKGLDRNTLKPSGYKNYMKLYIRADTAKTEIKRKYQKLMEFYADASSLLIAIYEIIAIILTFVNKFYENYSISKKLFLFKEVETDHFDLSLRVHKLKTLIGLTEPFKDILPTTTKKYENIEHIDTIKALEKNEIKIININNNEEIDKVQETEKHFQTKKLILKPNKKNTKKISFLNKEQTELQTVRTIKNEMVSEDRFNIKNYIIKTKVEDFFIDKIENPNKIKYDFNIFEIFANYACFCCLSKNMKLKRELNLKADTILNSKLDIVLFARNMILLDLMDKLLLDQDKEGIIKFLNRPTLYTKKKIEKKYKNYSENDFNNLFSEISDLVKKPDKSMIDKKFIFLSNQKLKELI